jgi:hypothetical protein
MDESLIKRQVERKELETILTRRKFNMDQIKINIGTEFGMT